MKQKTIKKKKGEVRIQIDVSEEVNNAINKQAVEEGRTRKNMTERIVARHFVNLNHENNAQA